MSKPLTSSDCQYVNTSAVGETGVHFQLSLVQEVLLKFHEPLVKSLESTSHSLHAIFCLLPSCQLLSSSLFRSTLSYPHSIEVQSLSMHRKLNFPLRRSGKDIE